MKDSTEFRRPWAIGDDPGPIDCCIATQFHVIAEPSLLPSELCVQPS
jgi:hypothetical protein